MRELSRREALGALTAAGVTGLAGCIDGIAQADDGSEPSDDGDGTGKTDEFTVYQTSVETVESNCRLVNRDPIAVAVKDEVVSLAGVKTASNPCQEVVLNTAVSGAELSVDVATEPQEDSDDCIQCIGSLEYEATVALSNDAVETVTVSHGEDGPTTTVDADEAPDEIVEESNETTPVETPESDPEPHVERIDTVETACATGEDSIQATRDGDSLSVEGVIGAPDPCHTAAISGISLSESALEVVVDVESEDKICQECVGEVRYEARIDLDGAEVERLVVDHGGNTHSIDLG